MEVKIETVGFRGNLMVKGCEEIKVNGRTCTAYGEILRTPLKYGSKNTAILKGRPYIMWFQDKNKIIAEEATFERFEEILLTINRKLTLKQDYSEDGYRNIFREFGLRGTDNWSLTQFNALRKLFQVSVNGAITGIFKAADGCFPLFNLNDTNIFGYIPTRLIHFKDTSIEDSSILHELSDLTEELKSTVRGKEWVCL